MFVTSIYGGAAQIQPSARMPQDPSYQPIRVLMRIRLPAHPNVASARIFGRAGRPGGYLQAPARRGRRPSMHPVPILKFPAKAALLLLTVSLSGCLNDGPLARQDRCFPAANAGPPED